MHLLDVRGRMMAGTLAALAGFVDALGFIGSGGYFLSFMSGNSTRMAVAVGEGTGLWLMPLALILAFVAGVAAGHVLGGGGTGHQRRGLLLVAVLLAAGALAAVGRGDQAMVIGLLLVAAAMGAENMVFAGQSDVRFGVTYMTGTLVKLGQRLADALTGRGSRTAWVPLFLHWLFLAAGAVAGAFAWGWLGFSALWLAAGIAALLAALSGLGTPEPKQVRNQG